MEMLFQPPTVPFWVSGVGVSSEWKTWMDLRLQHICWATHNIDMKLTVREATRLIGEKSMIDSAMYSRHFLPLIVGNDLWTFARKPLNETVDTWVTRNDTYWWKQPFQDAFLQPRLPYFLAGISIIILLSLIILLFSLCGRGFPCCFGKPRQAQKVAVSRETIFAKYRCFLILALFTLIIFPAMILLSSIRHTSNARASLYEVLCNMHRNGHNILFGTTFHNFIINPYNIYGTGNWIGLEWLWSTLNYWSERLDESRYSIANDVSRWVNTTAIHMNNSLSLGGSSLDKLSTSLIYTKKSLAELEDIRHVCVLCEALTDTRMSNPIADVHSWHGTIRTYIDEYLEKKDGKINEVKMHINELVQGPISIVRSYFAKASTYIVEYYTFLDTTASYVQHISHALWFKLVIVVGISCMFITLAVLLAVPTIRARVECVDSNLEGSIYFRVLAGAICSSWILLFLWATILFLCSAILILGVSIASQPFVFSIQELLLLNKYEAFPAIKDFAANAVSEDFVTSGLFKNITTQFLTAQGQANISHISKVNEFFEVAAKEPYDVKTIVADYFSELMNKIDKSPVEKLQHEARVLSQAFVIDLPSYITNDSVLKTELFAPRKVLLSGIQQYSIPIHYSIWRVNASAIDGTGWLLNILGSVSTWNTLYGMQDIEDSINEILNDPAYCVPKEYRNWCIKAYNDCADHGTSLTYGHVITGNSLLQTIKKVDLISAELRKKGVDGAKIFEFTRVLKNSGLWAERKSKLLQLPVFVILREGIPTGVEYFMYTNNSSIGAYMRVATTDFKHAVKEADGMLSNILEDFVKTTRIEIDRLRAAFRTAKILLFDASITVDSFCFGVAERIAKSAFCLILLGFSFLFGAVILYNIWGLLKEQPRNKITRHASPLRNKVEKNLINNTTNDVLNDREVYVEAAWP